MQLVAWLVAAGYIVVWLGCLVGLGGSPGPLMSQFTAGQRAELLKFVTVKERSPAVVGPSCGGWELRPGAVHSPAYIKGEARSYLAAVHLKW